jgi:hypothetical protein
MPPRNAMTDPNTMQALICLDNPVHQEACQQSLQVLGYTADVMPNQFKALEYLRQASYRLLYSTLLLMAPPWIRISS